MKEDVIKALKSVIDPEIHINVWDAGMIKEMKVDNRTVQVKFRPTSFLCPIALKLAVDIKKALLELEFIDKAEVEIVEHKDAEEYNKFLKQW